MATAVTPPPGMRQEEAVVTTSDRPAEPPADQHAGRRHAGGVMPKVMR
jgi:hypothetical protein